MRPTYSPSKPMPKSVMPMRKNAMANSVNTPCTCGPSTRVGTRDHEEDHRTAPGHDPGRKQSGRGDGLPDRPAAGAGGVNMVRTLVIDDDIGVCRALETFLVKEGHEE